jgi:hypothetical protein
MTHDHRPGRFAEPSTDRIPVVPQLPDQHVAGSDTVWESSGRPSGAWTPTKVVALLVIALVVLGSVAGVLAGALS